MSFLFQLTFLIKRLTLFVKERTFPLLKFWFVRSEFSQGTTQSGHYPKHYQFATNDSCVCQQHKPLEFIVTSSVFDPCYKDTIKIKVVTGVKSVKQSFLHGYKCTWLHCLYLFWGKIYTDFSWNIFSTFHVEFFSKELRKDKNPYIYALPNSIYCHWFFAYN